MILFLLHLHGCVTSDPEIPTPIPEALFSEIRSNLTFNNLLALNGVDQNNSQFSRKEKSEFLNDQEIPQRQKDVFKAYVHFFPKASREEIKQNMLELETFFEYVCGGQ